MMNEVSKFFSHNAEKLQPVKNLCDATAKLGESMAKGITKSHWLLNPDTVRSIQVLLSTNIDGK